MKANKVSKVAIVFFIVLFSISGCRNPNPGQDKIPNYDPNTISIYTQFAPVKIDILPLTEFFINKDNNKGEINLFVSMLDAFGAQIKSPAVFRFELYSRMQRSSELKGGRVMLWPEINLNDPKNNNDYWKDYFRSYEFNLPFESKAGQSYILEVTCLCPNNTRLISEFPLKALE